MDYRGEMARILADYTAASRGVLDRMTDVDAQTSRAGGAAFDRLHAAPEPDQPETERERAAREAREERDRRARNAALRIARRPGDEIVYPSDWTDIDRTRDEGAGPSGSWLD